MTFEGLGNTLRKFADDESGAGRPPSTEESKRLLHAAVVGAGMAGGIIAMHGRKADPRPVDPVAIEMSDRNRLNEMISNIERDAVPIQHFERKDFPEEEVRCLTDNVYHEARGEDAQGQFAVMFATLGRVLDKKYPKSICGVVHQPRQFSWTADNNVLAQPINMREYLKVAISVHDLIQGRDVAAAAVEAGLRAGLPRGAIYYKVRDFTGSPRVEKFFARLQHVASIGNHDFYVKRQEQKKQKRAPRAKTAGARPIR